MTFIHHELDGSGSCIGYRAMHQMCIRNGLMVSPIIVGQIMKRLDPIGANVRRKETLKSRLYYSLGQNWVGNFDGYDKLKPYGFEMHGCIDGYSRRILCLSVIRSNKGPKEVCNLYFNYLFIAKGAPQKIVADRGTENVNIAGSQRFLRRNHSDNSSGYFSLENQ